MWVNIILSAIETKVCHLCNSSNITMKNEEEGKDHFISPSPPPPPQKSVIRLVSFFHLVCTPKVVSDGWPVKCCLGHFCPKRGPTELCGMCACVWYTDALRLQTNMSLSGHYDTNVCPCVLTSVDGLPGSSFP